MRGDNLHGSSISSGIRQNFLNDVGLSGSDCGGDSLIMERIRALNDECCHLAGVLIRAVKALPGNLRGMLKRRSTISSLVSSSEKAITARILSLTHGRR